VLFTKLKSKAAHLIRGENAEEQAHQFLIEKGLKPICRNYRCKLGELDIIMSDQQSLVIIEVKYRKTDQFGSALENIAYSGSKLPPIPDECCHPFHFKAATNSG
jgi:putative endonuclease